VLFEFVKLFTIALVVGSVVSFLLLSTLPSIEGATDLELTGQTKMNHSDAPEVVLYDDPEVIPTEKKPGNLVAPQVPKRRALVGDIRAPTFWIIVAIVAIIVIAAAVGGAVGGTNAIRKKYAGSSISRHAITHLTASYRHLETIRSIRYVAKLIMFLVRPHLQHLERKPQHPWFGTRLQPPRNLRLPHPLPLHK